MRAAAANLLKVLQGTKQFIIPIYQRTYSWEIAECQQLWNDVIHVALDDNIPTHFFGSIAYAESSVFRAASVTQLLLIDGQQRLTTLFLLLAALGEAANETKTEALREGTKQHIYNSYLFNTDESDDTRYKLLLTQSDRETLIQTLEGAEEPQSIPTRIQQNHLFFKKQINQCGIEPATIFRGISKLIVVDISLETRDNPQLIFEGLNSTGVALSQADLIRNYILMGLDHKEQVKLYKAYWYPMEQRFSHTQNATLFNRFMRDYLTLKSKTGEIPNIDGVYAVFKSYQQSLGATPISELVADIYRYARYFTNIASVQDKDSTMRKHFSTLNALQVQVAYPFLLSVYDDYEKQVLSKQDFIAILKLVESYVFRRAICGIPTNSLNKIFATLAREIDKEQYLESTKVALLQKTANSRFPGDEEFQAEFVVKDMYNFRNRNYLLNKLENYKQKELVIIEEYTIEHIMPQNAHLPLAWRKELGPDWKKIHAQYLHTIGNLTLTGYNANLSDRPFLEKRDYRDGGFKSSPLRLNRGLGELEHWNEEEITKRARVLADLAVKIWPIPILIEEIRGLDMKKSPITTNSIQAPEPAIVEVMRYTVEDHLAHMPFDMRGIFERLRKRILNLDASIQEEVRRHSISYIAITHLVDIELRKKRLILTLNAKSNTIDDPCGLCRSKSGSEDYHGSGEIEIHITTLDQIEDALYLIRQIFEKQGEEVCT